MNTTTMKATAAQTTERKLSKTERRAQKKNEERLAKEAASAKSATPEKKDASKTNSKKGEVEKNKKVLENANVEKAAAKAAEKTLMYIYPEDVKTQEDKKTFRRKMRAQNNHFAKNLAKLQKSTDQADKKKLAEMEAEYGKFKKEHYTKP